MQSGWRGLDGLPGGSACILRVARIAVDRVTAAVLSAVLAIIPRLLKFFEIYVALPCTQADKVDIVLADMFPLCRMRGELPSPTVATSF